MMKKIMLASALVTTMLTSSANAEMFGNWNVTPFPENDLCLISGLDVTSTVVFQLGFSKDLADQNGSMAVGYTIQRDRINNKPDFITLVGEEQKQMVFPVLDFDVTSEVVTFLSITNGDSVLETISKFFDSKNVIVGTNTTEMTIIETAYFPQAFDRLSGCISMFDASEW